jgi:exopolyphosphatase/guanosine-5'-triphosphate,3'-diphosphate pyrophosphatase
MKPSLFAAIDLGSNSFRMHIGAHDGSAVHVVKSVRDPIRLGAGMDEDGNLTDEAMQTALASLQHFKEVLATYPLDAVRVAGTNTLRVAKNSADFMPLAEAAIGYPIEVLSGEEEGRLIYFGVASTLPASHERRLVVDIGGGSTELILGTGREVERVESFSIGTVPQSQGFFADGAIDAKSFKAAILSARSYFEDGGPPFYSRNWSKAYGSSGTIRSLSEVIMKNGLGDGKLSYESLEALMERFIACRRIDKVNLAGLKLERVPNVIGGLTVLMGMMQELGIKTMTAVEAGLRMGIMWDLHLRATQHDRRELSVRDFMQRFQVDTGRANQVAHTAGVLFTQLKPATDIYGKYVYWSGLLHEVGQAVSHTGYHKHGAYIVGNADLPGFTARDQRVLSTLVLAQKGNLRKVGELVLSDADLAKSALALRLAVMFMHSRIPVEMGDFQVKMKNRIDIDINANWISDHPTIAYWIGKERAFWEEIGVGFSVRTSA